MSDLSWGTFDLDALFPETVCHSVGGEVEYRINHYVPERDGKKLDRGDSELWFLSTKPISTVTPHRTLEDAKAAAAK